MITDFDLLDLAAVFELLSFDTYSENNAIIIHRVIDVLLTDNSNFEDNQIRRALASIADLDKAGWEFVRHNYYYLTHRLLKNKAIC